LNGNTAIQLCLILNAKIIVTCSNKNEESYLIESFQGNISIINLEEQKLFETINRLTNGLGVDIILEDIELPDGITEREIVNCLTINATWITSRNLQLDPPISELLYLKGCSVSFLFEQAWTLSETQSGIFLHILDYILSREWNIPSNLITIASVEEFQERYNDIKEGQNVIFKDFPIN